MKCGNGCLILVASQLIFSASATFAAGYAKPSENIGEVRASVKQALGRSGEAKPMDATQLRSRVKSEFKANNPSTKERLRGVLAGSDGKRDEAVTRTGVGHPETEIHSDSVPITEELPAEEIARYVPRALRTDDGKLDYEAIEAAIDQRRPGLLRRTSTILRERLSSRDVTMLKTVTSPEKVQFLLVVDSRAGEPIVVSASPFVFPIDKAPVVSKGDQMMGNPWQPLSEQRRSGLFGRKKLKVYGHEKMFGRDSAARKVTDFVNDDIFVGTMSELDLRVTDRNFSDAMGGRVVIDADRYAHLGGAFVENYSADRKINPELTRFLHERSDSQRGVAMEFLREIQAEDGRAAFALVPGEAFELHSGTPLLDPSRMIEVPVIYELKDGKARMGSVDMTALEAARLPRPFAQPVLSPAARPIRHFPASAMEAVNAATSGQELSPHLDRNGRYRRNQWLKTRPENNREGTPTAGADASQPE